jgi:hypothetical protein
MGVYRGESSIELLETISKSKADDPGLEVHEIGGVLGLAGSMTAFCAANGCGIEAERRLPTTAPVDGGAWGMMGFK